MANKTYGMFVYTVYGVSAKVLVLPSPRVNIKGESGLKTRILVKLFLVELMEMKNLTVLFELFEAFHAEARLAVGIWRDLTGTE